MTSLVYKIKNLELVNQFEPSFIPLFEVPPLHDVSPPIWRILIMDLKIVLNAAYLINFEVSHDNRRCIYAYVLSTARKMFGYLTHTAFDMVIVPVADTLDGGNGCYQSVSNGYVSNMLCSKDRKEVTWDYLERACIQVMYLSRTYYAVEHLYKYSPRLGEVLHAVRDACHRHYKKQHKITTAPSKRNDYPLT